MSHGRDKQNYLFAESDMFATIEQRKQQVKSWVDSLDENHITNSSIEDLCTYVENEFRLDTPELQDDHALVDQREAEVEVNDNFLYGHFDEFSPAASFRYVGGACCAIHRQRESFSIASEYIFVDAAACNSSE